LLLRPVGLWRLANQNPISGRPISMKHEPDVRRHQRLWTTVPAWQRVKTTVPARAARSGDLFPSVSSEQVSIHRPYCDGNTRGLSRSDYLRDERAFIGHGYHQG